MINIIDEQEFQYWLFRMDDVLDDFADFIKKCSNIILDYSADSVSELESWLMKRYSSHNEAIKFDQRIIIDAASRYLGEYARKKTTLKWSVDFANPDAAHFAVPLLNSAHPYVPQFYVSAACDRRTGHFLLTTLNNLIKNYSV
ncbi:hypothetical protein [Deinococcus sonorensis]|uniref:Uncharacterized protein n=2 Tax=Deinococcus sonorensis TaxID=309891 RepID=A0AAU7U5C3_9DEIO